MSEKLKSETPVDASTACSAFWVLFEHMSQEHGLFLLDSELSDICHAVDRMRAEWKSNELKRQCKTCMGYNHRCERDRMAKVIRRLVRYADRVAERYPQAVTIHGQNARIEGGIWLAEFDRQNAERIHLYHNHEKQ